jgi:hypothetical protein
LTTEVTIVKLMWSMFVLVCAVPALFVAIALGPVVIGVLCAVGCAALVAGIAYLLGVTAGSIEKAGARLTRRGSRF